MAVAITLQVRRAFTQNGFQDYRPSNKAIIINTDAPWSVKAFADTSDTSVYSVVLRRPVAGVQEQYYCAQTAAAILALAVA